MFNICQSWVQSIYRCPYSAVGELTYGKKMRIFVNIMLNITVFGAGIPNILVGMHWLMYFCRPHEIKSYFVFYFSNCFDAASQNLQLIGQRISDGEFQFSFCYWLILLGIIMCPVMWLGSPKNMKYFELQMIVWTFFLL